MVLHLEDPRSEVVWEHNVVVFHYSLVNNVRQNDDFVRDRLRGLTTSLDPEPLETTSDLLDDLVRIERKTVVHDSETDICLLEVYLPSKHNIV